MVITMYSGAIHEAMAGGDLQRMRDVARQAEDWLQQTGDVAASLETLRLEIRKHERGIVAPVLPDRRLRTLTWVAGAALLIAVVALALVLIR